jgi:ribosomal protein S8
VVTGSKQNSIDNLKNVSRQGSRYFRKNEYLKAKIDELEANKFKSTRDVYRDISN